MKAVYVIARAVCVVNGRDKQCLFYTTVCNMVHRSVTDSQISIIKQLEPTRSSMNHGTAICLCWMYNCCNNDGITTRKYNKQTQIFWSCNLSAADQAVWKPKIHKLLMQNSFARRTKSTTQFFLRQRLLLWDRPPYSQSKIFAATAYDQCLAKHLLAAFRQLRYHQNYHVPIWKRS